MTELDYTNVLADLSHSVTMLEQIVEDLDPDDRDSVTIAAQVKAAIAILENAGA